MNKNIWIIIAIMMTFTASAEQISQDVEIRGTVTNGTYMYNADSFAGFWYDIDNGLTSETLNVTVTGRDINEGNLIYQSKPCVVAYENPELGDYTILGFMAEKFVAYDNKTDQLVKLLIEWTGSDDAVLTVGESLEMPEGYNLLVREIDLDGGKVVVVLSKGGTEIDTEIIPDNTTFRYLDDNDVMIFSVKVDSVFRGTDTNIVVIKYLFLMSEDVLDVNTGDNFGIMKITSTSNNGITLKNDDGVTLNEDDEVEIMGDLYFKVADSSSLRYYLAKSISLTCPTCEDCPACEECPEPEPCPDCPPCPVINETGIIPDTIIDSPPTNEAPTKSLPGFEAIMAIFGLTAVGYIVLRQKD